jgi:hypothetical protein
MDQLMQPDTMFFMITLIGIGFIKIVEHIRKHCSLSKFEQTAMSTAIVVYLTFFLISFSSFIGPAFFQVIGYHVNNTTTDTITAFDATSCLASSILAAIFGLMAIEMSQKESTKEEKQ